MNGRAVFNDLIRAFLVRAVTSAGLDDDTIDQIMQQCAISSTDRLRKRS